MYRLQSQYIVILFVPTVCSGDRMGKKLLVSEKFFLKTYIVTTILTCYFRCCFILF